MFRGKRAQAAMEFLMTYGWAILVVLAAIGALAYFGVLSPDRFLPEKCTMPSGMACLDFTVTGNSSNPTFNLMIQNSAGFDMSAASVNLSGNGGSSAVACTAQTGLTFADGVQQQVNIPCSGASSGKFKADLEVTYTNSQTGLVHTKVGELIAKVN